MSHRWLAADEPNPLGFVWSEFILVLIVFGLLLWLISKFVVPRFESTFATRRAEIVGGIERAEEAQREAAELLRQYRAQLAEARTEAAQIRDGARAEGQRIVEELRTQAQEESARIVSRGEEQLNAQRGQVVRELRGEIGTLAVELSEKIVGEHLADDAAVRRTVDAFLADIERQEESDRLGAAPDGRGPAGGDQPPGNGQPAGGRPADAPAADAQAGSSAADAHAAASSAAEAQEAASRPSGAQSAGTQPGGTLPAGGPSGGTPA